MALRALADGSVFAEVTGSSSPRILALHGWARRGNDFGPVLSGLDAIAPDLPGFGASPEPPGVMGAEGYARLIRPILDEFRQPPVVIGHSFGGRVAVCLAEVNPDRVGPLVLTGVPLVKMTPSRTPDLGYRIAKGLNRFGLLSDARLEREKKRRGSSDYRAAGGVMRDILVTVVNESYEEQLRGLKGPVRLVWGGRDSEVPLEVAEVAVRILTDAGVEADLTVLEGIGHLTPSEAPGHLRAAVLEFLRR